MQMTGSQLGGQRALTLQNSISEALISSQAAHLCLLNYKPKLQAHAPFCTDRDSNEKMLRTKVQSMLRLNILINKM